MNKKDYEWGNYIVIGRKGTEHEYRRFIYNRDVRRKISAFYWKLLILGGDETCRIIRNI